MVFKLFRLERLVWIASMVGVAFAAGAQTTTPQEVFSRRSRIHP